MRTKQSIVFVRDTAMLETVPLQMVPPMRTYCTSKHADSVTGISNAI